MSAAADSVHRMQHGFIFTGTDPNLAVELAPLAETSGWDGFFVWEGIWATDPWATLAAAAMVTDRIRLGTMLTPVPRRRPWELAGQTMTVDRLSNGRVILSAGLGVPAAEPRFWIFEDDPGRKHRAEVLDESFDLMQRLWRGEPFEFEGEHFHAHRTDVMLPPPIVQEPRIPTWVVGAWPRLRSMRRVVHYDGWIPNFAPGGADGVQLEVQSSYTPQVAAEAIAWVLAEREKAGLGDRTFDIVQEGSTEGTDRAADAAVVRQWADAGVTWWLESNWQVPAEEVADYARGRLRAGPPILSG
jgi:alkanesulfonate monooxygenase SsuD/methylene tetrahydromethanopterin reductase-like flavin-dependent oxidoreductase (luciferase family)